VVEMVIDISGADESSFYVINEAVQNPFQVARVHSDSVKTQMDQYRKGSNENGYEKFIIEVASDKIPLLVAENNGTLGIPRVIRSLILVPLMIREKVFGVLTASIYEGCNRFTEKDLYYLAFMTNKASYTIENIALYENIYENLFSTLYAFVKAIEAKDPYTQQHSNRVTDIALSIAKEIGCSDEDLEILNVAGRLHDIGKIGIRDNILLKPSKLTEKELEKIRKHPDIGADIVGQLGLWDSEQKTIRYHHERVDGKGFPKGLKKGEIPLLARILSVADSYDAMASDRSYRKKMNSDEIIRIIKKESGAQFDPDIVKVFFKLYKEGKIKQHSDITS
ncbi:MAG: HD domain-containing protein, partial [Desulfobacterales bacterium]|nr:HD domain-containing protein [Desulfobacterales bacterium]